MIPNYQISGIKSMVKVTPELKVTKVKGQSRNIFQKCYEKD